MLDRAVNESFWDSGPSIGLISVPELGRVSLEQVPLQKWYSFVMKSNSGHNGMTGREIRPGTPIREDWRLEDSTPEELINAVWELTLSCLAWGSDDGELRLQRSAN